MTELLRNVGVADVLDVLIVAALMYLLFVALLRTRTTFVLAGVGVIAVFYVAAVSAGLQLTTFLLQLLFTVGVLGVIVVFHDEIRVAAERLFSWRPARRRRREPAAPVKEALLAALPDLARDRIGALIALRGRDDPARFVHGGYPLEGIVSEPLFKSIFDAHSIGHDGAMVISGDRATRFGAHLPLSTNAAVLGSRGTRHAAALGLSEKTDALVLVVSEERGVISVARRGQLEPVADSDALAKVLDAFLEEHDVHPTRPFWHDALRRHLGLKAVSVAAAAVLWFLVVRESETAYESYTIPLTAVGLPDGLELVELRPTEVKLTVSGARRSFYLVDARQFRVDLQLFQVLPGRDQVPLTATDVRLPGGLKFVSVGPRFVNVTTRSPEP